MFIEGVLQLSCIHRIKVIQLRYAKKTEDFSCLGDLRHKQNAFAENGLVTCSKRF